ncbi:sugar phosphate isomerase/epimerase [Alteromonadaceae bacterium M269]|nr:sugar phosphate isomerase/epimerase [Alteromonadaceae bacterium M269]
MSYQSRREFIKHLAFASAAVSLGGCHSVFQPTPTPKPLFDISLAQWSLHRTLFGAKTSAERLRGLSGPQVADTLRNNPKYLLRGSLDPMDFPAYAKSQFGISAVEYVNTFYLGKARDTKYLSELKLRAYDAGVKNVLIMCDLEGDLGHPDKKERITAVKNHYQWVEAAALLGCHAIRVNAKSAGTWQEQVDLAAEGLSQLADYAARYDINVLVENHGGLSSNPKWLTSVMKTANHKRLGTLPDFGNFRISESEHYDYYQGVKELMPYARAVSAKSIDFNAKGEHSTFDYDRMMRIVIESGYRGFVGIEYEGEHLSEQQGIEYTLAQLQHIREQLSQGSTLSI